METVEQIINEVLARGFCITPATYQAYRQAHKHLLQQSDAGTAITSREIEILRLIHAGNINKQIADKLCLSVNTVANHRSSMMSKTNTHNVAQLLLYAEEHGLL